MSNLLLWQLFAKRVLLHVLRGSWSKAGCRAPWKWKPGSQCIGFTCSVLLSYCAPTVCPLTTSTVIFELSFFSPHPSTSHFFHLHKGFPMAVAFWLLLGWPGHRNQHWNLPAVLSGNCFMPSGCKGAMGLQAVGEGRQVPHTCQTWTIILAVWFYIAITIYTIWKCWYWSRWIAWCLLCSGRNPLSSSFPECNS